MVTESQIQSVALFFVLAFLDERLAVRATLKTVTDLRRLSEKRGAQESLSEKQIVSQTFSNWKHFKRYQEGTSNPLLGGSMWTVAKGFDIGPWRQFRKESIENEYLVVLWHQVLGLSTEAISEALGVPDGTIRYRMSNGLKKLGTATLGGFHA
jgi:hypothetical protein